MKPIHIFLVCLGALFLSSCDEDFECSSDNTVPIPQNMKDFFYFKEGTWWVYYNTKTHLYDSLWVRKSSLNVYRGEGREGFGKIDKCYEQTSMAIDAQSTISPLEYLGWGISNR